MVSRFCKWQRDVSRFFCLVLHELYGLYVVLCEPFAVLKIVAFGLARSGKLVGDEGAAAMPSLGRPGKLVASERRLGRRNARTDLGPVGAAARNSCG